MSVLTQEQLRLYEEQGYLLVSGLIPPEVAEQGEAALWKALGAKPDDPATWAGLPFSGGYSAPELTACFTPEFRAAAAQLAQEDVATFRPPERVFTINVFPQEGEWQWPRPHIDHAIKEAGHKTFPRAFRIAAMTYLSDVPSHGAGTIVWPGSHLKLEALAKSDPERYELMWALNQDIPRAGIGEPVELTPRRGDVLFYHYLCAHAGSKNTSDRPRLALNMKW